MYYLDFKSPDTMVEDLDAIRNAIKNILLTKKGSLPGKPEFGSNLYYYLFEPLDHIIIQNIKTDLETCLRKYEPRIQVINIEIEDDEAFHRIDISITFKYIIYDGITETTLVFTADKLYN